jgi:hypothetical protein
VSTTIIIVEALNTPKCARAREIQQVVGYFYLSIIGIAHVYIVTKSRKEWMWA